MARILIPLLKMCKPIKNNEFPNIATRGLRYLLLNRGRGEKEDLWKQREIEAAETARQKAEVRER